MLELKTDLASLLEQIESEMLAVHAEAKKQKEAASGISEKGNKTFEIRAEDRTRTPFARVNSVAAGSPSDEVRSWSFCSAPTIDFNNIDNNILL